MTESYKNDEADKISLLFNLPAQLSSAVIFAQLVECRDRQDAVELRAIVAHLADVLDNHVVNLPLALSLPW